MRGYIIMDRKITVNFEVNFGSQYQSDFFIRMLQAMLDALKIHMELSHKQNKIIYEIDTHDGYKIKKV